MKEIRKFDNPEQEPEPVEMRVSDDVLRLAYICDRCGFEMIERNCKVICPNCGSRWDCSDLSIYTD